MMLSNLRYLFLAACAGSLLAGYAGLYLLMRDLPYVPEDLRQLVYARPTEIYADDGTLVYSLGGQSYVPLAQMSPHFQKAVIAVEDGSFRSHHGIDLGSNLRAFMNTIFKGRRLGGASTISQQLAKNLFFSHHRAFLRKVKDMLVAMQLESMFTKDQILEAYCNLVYFGGAAYGVEDAARQFFDKSAGELALPEAALLAGILNSPFSLNPFAHADRAKRRQLLVLRRMLAEGFITQSEYDQATADSLVYIQRRRRSNDYVDHILALAEDRYGREAVNFGGLKIYTTLDQDLQRIAETELRTGITRLKAELDSVALPLQGAVAVVAVPTGEVKALVGSGERVPGGFNRAVSANRHIGSGIKPFLYYGALDQLELNPYTQVNDSLISYRLPTGQRYRPRNFDRLYDGPMTLKWALMKSKNTVAVQLGERMGPAALAAVVRRFGITSELDEVLSLALGTSGVSPVEMAAAYAIFARTGVAYTSSFIKRVEDFNGIVLDRGPLQIGRQALDARRTAQVLDMMQGVVEAGTAALAVRASGFDAPAAGKTGTSYDFTDAWFTGVTSSLSASVWVGYDRQAQLRRKNGRGATGGYAAAPIWGRIMRRAASRYPARSFQQPDGLRPAWVDPVHGWQSDDPERQIRVLVDELEQVPARPWEFDSLFRSRQDSLMHGRIRQ